MPTGIYAKLSDGAFTLLEATPFVLEEDLQTLIASHPALLGGEQISPDNPRRWLLVKREFGVPDSDDGGARFRLDHLFLDQDAVPTIIEAKRKADSRSRRDVVGQLFEYGAHATVFLSADDLRASFEQSCRASGEDSNQLIDHLMQSSASDIDAFWNRVGEHLANGRVRLIFVADQLSSEVKRIIEFLNPQMSPGEVLGVEILHYTDGNIRTFVPRVVGVSETAIQRKETTRRAARRWDEGSFFDDLSLRVCELHAMAMRELYNYVRESEFVCAWGKGLKDGSVIVKSKLPGEKIVITLNSDGRLFIYFAGIQGSKELDEIRESLRDYFANVVEASLGAGTESAAPATDWWKRVDRVIAKLQEIESAMAGLA